jgi:hypothetical protein
MGNDWIIWDRPQEEARNDYMTHQFLQNQGTKIIPLVKRMVEFKARMVGTISSSCLEPGA